MTRALRAALSPEVVAVSQDLGYLPRAPERDGVKAVVNAALASQLEDAIAKLEAELAEAKAAGDKRKVKDAEEALAARKIWLDALG